MAGHMNKEKTDHSMWQFILRMSCLAALILLLAIPSRTQPRAAGEPKVLAAPAENGVFMNPRWSPDGKTIAFTADHYNGLWLMNADGTNVRLLTADEGAGFGYEWSPAGDLILARPVINENRRRFHQVKVYDTRNGSYEILVDQTRSLNGLPKWTPDGAQVALLLDRQPQFRRSERFPAQKASADNPVVLALNDKLISVTPLNKSVASLNAFDGRVVFNLTASPDGNKVAFQLQGQGLHVMNADGTHLKQLGRGEYASWLPGSRYAVVAETEDDGHFITGGELYVVDTETGEYTHITGHTGVAAHQPDVSPCGKWVVFDNPLDGKIYIMELK
jgi:Tol biopolymer transport system component